MFLDINKYASIYVLNLHTATDLKDIGKLRRGRVSAKIQKIEGYFVNDFHTRTTSKITLQIL